ncbi:MAG: Crp/Fnr family transcriptional regulator [Anaerolineae bacterium]|nr:Crp/Fnr family transcriptional regulator [Anaerolineae bacterium]
MIEIDTLSGLSALRNLRPSTLQCIASYAQAVKADVGETLYRQGDPPSGLFVLRDGRVKLYRQSRDRSQILAIPIPGECFGAESLSTGAPSPCSAVALTRVLTIYIPPQALGELLAEHADLQELLLELITHRLKQFVSLVHDLAFRDVTSRLAAILVARAQTEGQLVPEGIILDRLLSQQEFAAMAGTAREVIYRNFKKLEDDGLLRLSRHSILILDFDRLARIAAQEAR